MYKLLLTSFFVINLIQINGQSISLQNLRLGFYFGGASYSNEKAGIGYYYFKKDSSFLFLGTTFNKRVPQNGNMQTSFTDTIAAFGKGKWFIKDNFFIIKFETVEDCNLYDDEVLSQSFSKSPYDSLYIKIQATNKINQSPVPGAIVIKESNQLVMTDTSGYVEIKMPFKHKEINLTFSNPEFHVKTIVLNQTNNMHDIKLNLVKKDAPYINVIPAFNFPSKFNINVKKEISISLFKKDNGGLQKLEMIINNGYKKMPEQKYFLDKIMKEVKFIKE